MPSESPSAARMRATRARRRAGNVLVRVEVPAELIERLVARNPQCCFDPRLRMGGDAPALTYSPLIENSRLDANMANPVWTATPSIRPQGQKSRVPNNIAGARTPRDYQACFRFALRGRPPQTMSEPFRSAPGLAPTCSTRRCQFAPSK